MPPLPSYRVWLRPAVHQERRYLPGHIRQRIIRIVDELAENPRPVDSRELVLLSTSIPTGWEVRRLRLNDWRIVYAVSEDWLEIGILTIQKRPPYDYANLDQLLSDLHR